MSFQESFFAAARKSFAKKGSQTKGFSKQEKLSKLKIIKIIHLQFLLFFKVSYRHTLPITIGSKILICTSYTKFRSK